MSLRIVFQEIRDQSQANHLILRLISKNVSRPHEIAKPAFSNFSGLKSVFENFHFQRWISVDGKLQPRSQGLSSCVVWTRPWAVMSQRFLRRCELARFYK